MPTNSGATKGRAERIFAVCGKGGVGKTAFTAMFTKALLDSGKAGRLLVIDADPALGLTNALGMRIERTMGQVREGIINAARSGNNTELAELTNTLDYLVMEALAESDRLALLAMGRSESLGCFCPVNDLLRDAIKLLSSRFDTILIDGEAGLEQINRQVMDELDCLIMLTDTSTRGLQTVSLLKDIVEDKKIIRCKKAGVVFNRVQDNEEILNQSAERLGVEVLGFIPQDSRITDFDLIGRSLRELPPESVALSAVQEIVDSFF